MLKNSILSLIIISIVSCSSMKTTTVTGIVQSVEKGKDGYTAQIKTTKSTIYFAVISIPNLRKPEKYREFKTGEKVTLFGEIWKMEGENRITVRKILD